MADAGEPTEVVVAAMATTYRVRQIAADGVSLVPWPTRVGAVLEGPWLVLCVGPREWLAFGRDAAAQESLPITPTHLRADFACVELTQGLSCVRVSGPDALECLASACALDLHTACFKLGSCAPTRLAGVRAVIHRVKERSFDCYVAASYQAYVLAMLRDAVGETAALF